MTDALVIGAGPAGLMAAEHLASAGLSTLVAEAKPSVGRKFLMAGKSGLNLTKSEEFSNFMSHYDFSKDLSKDLMSEFDPPSVIAWAEGLGQTVFTGSSGRVFPEAMKASPLLRAWLARLDALQVEIKTRWRWTGWMGGHLSFDTPDGTIKIQPKVTVLALGGGSWARLGSDGAWLPKLAGQSVHVRPFKASNVGVSVPWSAHMVPVFGRPVKAVKLSAGGKTNRGEVIISKDGIEGGGIYALSPQIRNGAPLTLDLLPDWSVEKINQRWAAAPRKQSLSNRFRKALRLGPEKTALAMEFGHPFADEPGQVLKALPIQISGVRPVDEAISTAGGVALDQLNETLMLKALPGVFCAGEMLDWDAPTGGYLLTACFATGRWAGRHAAAYALGAEA